jgi:hypothetical protein
VCLSPALGARSSGPQWQIELFFLTEQRHLKAFIFVLLHSSSVLIIGFSQDEVAGSAST